MNTEETYNEILKESWFPAKPNDMAFPCPDSQSGLTKREFFAAMAMQGLCANSVPGGHHEFEFLTKEAVKYADSLITQLNKQP